MKLIKLTYTDKFRNLLTVIIDNPVAKTLLQIEGRSYFLPFNNIGFINNTSKITVKMLKNDNTIEMKVGKFVNKLYTSIGKETTNAILEEFINKYKGMSMFDETFSNFELVTGKDIKKYYHHTKYTENKGILGNSCMKHDRHQKFLKIYTKNPEKVSLLILKDKDTDTIKGRAIVWQKISMRPGEKGEVKSFKVNFMDRIYSYDDSVTEQFKHYAKLKGWAYKKVQNSDITGPFIYNNEILPNETKFYFYLENSIDLKKFPYLDTLTKFSTEKGFISNRKFKDSIELTSTDGTYYN